MTKMQQAQQQIPSYPQYHGQHIPQQGASVPADKSALNSLKKPQTKVFSTIVKAACLLILLAGFLPFATISCGPIFQESINGYNLALGSAADRAAELSQGNMGLGMGMGAGQLAALNMLAGGNFLLAAAFAGTALLLLISFVLSRTRVELALALVAPAFSLAIYLQWLGIFSAFTDMFNAASERGGAPMSAGPDIGLYAVIGLSLLLLLVAILEACRALPNFLTGEEKSQDFAQAPAPYMTMPPAVYTPGVPAQTATPTVQVPIPASQHTVQYPVNYQPVQSAPMPEATAATDIAAVPEVAVAPELVPASAMPEVTPPFAGEEAATGDQLTSLLEYPGDTKV
jgi:hypothetical protein